MVSTCLNWIGRSLIALAIGFLVGAVIILAVRREAPRSVTSSFRKLIPDVPQNLVSMVPEDEQNSEKAEKAQEEMQEQLQEKLDDIAELRKRELTFPIQGGDLGDT